ncbi:mitochondrial respiratory chain complex I protein [Malassezia pachydermatis]|uniref:NADH dehydrogenase [ubiquinone] 1 beta subcomplex subunit 9 n=1 Tax=Malassezia pachydermatis TaxID=77020 RepID=A0A0M9VNN7_9BASI|nr:nadh dehydrogenase 1 beta subcomplex subunit 9 [Malassezia pachydermatis]KOS13549.1 nadh dehydrogenase 1 beta subcomplex subunit 9 [Malassezia pachydermatis]
MFVTTARLSAAPPAFSALHKQYVMGLYRRFLRDSLNWHIRRDTWRKDAVRIRAEFEVNRNVRNPRELANILNRAEEQLASRQHPDPYKPPTYVGGTKWERNLPPRMFTDKEKAESLKDQRV